MIVDGAYFTIDLAKKDVCTAKFSKKVCVTCNLKEACRIQFQKKANIARFDKDRYLRDIYRSRMKTDEFTDHTNQRAGFEGLPFVFRRFYNIDSMPVRGKVRSKLYFGFKVLASN